MESIFQPPNMADIFETVLVPSIFGPYARDLVERARPIGPSDRVLDLGCGTGIVARVLRERLGGGSRIAGIDVTAPMIAKARAVAPELEWHEGDAMALPFPDGSFDLVLCQQMFQFVPGRQQALREAHRVLVPGGRLLAATWRGRAEQPLFELTGTIAERHLGPSRDKRWSLDGETFRREALEVGFHDIRIETASVAEHHRQFPIRASAMAANHDLSVFTEEERERRLAAVEAETAPALESLKIDGVIVNRSITNVLIAVA